MKQDNIDNNPDQAGKVGRRDLIKGLATIPVVGAYLYAWYRKQKFNKMMSGAINEEIKLSEENPVFNRKVPDEPQIRLGIIGSGGRGLSLLKAAGFLYPEKIDEWKESAQKNNTDKRYDEFLEQEDLNLVVNGVCDIFDVNAEKALNAGANIERIGFDGKLGSKPKRYKSYKELLKANDIDAVIIATPDHWHGTMSIEAARAGKHVYCEKPMTWTVPETYEVVKAVKENNIVFQLGHQNRQTESYFKAKEAIEKNLLGKVNLIEVTTLFPPL